jgi:hypothetical protein
MGVAAAAGPLLGGLLIEFVPGRGAVLICAAGIALVTLLVTANRTLRRTPEAPPEAAPPHSTE